MIITIGSLPYFYIAHASIHRVEVHSISLLQRETKAITIILRGSLERWVLGHFYYTK